MISAHGGRLVNRIAQGERRQELQQLAVSAPRVTLNSREVSDLEMIATGAMSPLEGFMGRGDLNSVVNSCRLSSGAVWPLPVTLSDKGGQKLEIDAWVGLQDARGTLLGLMLLKEIFTNDKDEEARLCLGTNDKAHPGVQYLDTLSGQYLAGPVWLLEMPTYDFANEYRLTPRETRVLFHHKGWKTVVAFQTRNPIHRAHEYLTKCALEVVDGLLIHPLVGDTKGDDIPAKVRMQCYHALLARYYPKKRVALAVYPQAMRYAGPREAIFHALIRKNYGCTHFIVGRDHAGVGNYYGTFEAQEIFNNFTRSEIGITPLMFEHAFWDKISGAMATDKTTAASRPEDKIFLSGTKVREMLSRGERPPVEFTRPEVADILIASMAAKTTV